MTHSELAELKKLRDLAADPHKCTAADWCFCVGAYLHELWIKGDALIAAAEECERLREALRHLVEGADCWCSDLTDEQAKPCPHCRARAALEGKP